MRKTFYFSLFAALALMLLPQTATLAQTGADEVTFTLSGARNDMNLTVDESSGTYTVVTTGTDPYVYTNDITTAIPDDATVLAFDYICTDGIPNMQIFFPNPLDETHTIRGIEVPSTGTDQWKTFRLNILEYRRNYAWGKAGDKMRLDFGGIPDVTIQIRNIRVNNATEEESDDLQDYLDNLPYAVEDYVNGPEPGCVGDTAIYTKFFDAYSTAMEVAGRASTTAEQKAAALEALKSAKAEADAAIVPIADGTYYIQTAYSAFDGKDTMAWYAPRRDNQPGWHKKAASLLSMWNIRKLDDGNYSIQNAATGQYINHNATVDATDQPLLLSDGLETEQVIAMIKPNGQFNIHSLGASWVYNIQGHSSGNATDGPIANWTDKAVSGEGAWRVIPVPEADMAAAQATQYRDLLAATVKAFTDNYQVSSDPGYYSKDAYDAFIAEHNAAQALAEDAQATEEACKAELDKLSAARATLDNALVPITDGYYAILYRPYDVSLENPDKAWKVNGDSGYPYTFTWDSGDPDFIWKITATGKDRYSVQSYTTKEYIGTSDLLMAWASVSLSDNPTTPQTFTPTGIGRFRASNPALTASGFCYTMNGENAVTLYIVNISKNTIDVYLHKYTDEEVAAIVAAYPQKLRNDTLKSLVAEAAKRTNDIDSAYLADAVKENPELGTALDGLRSAITAGQAKVDAGGASSQDIADFRSAYTEFLLSWKDTTDLYSMYTTAEAFLPTIMEGNDMFCYPSDKVSDFRDAFDEVDAAFPLSGMSQREVARLDTLLTRAYNELLRSMVGPDPDTWYTVFSMDATQNDKSGNPISGQIAWIGGYTASDGLGCGGSQEEAMLNDLRRAWKFEPTGTPNVYNMIAVGSGWPINRGPVRLAGLGDGQFVIYTGSDLNSVFYIRPDLLPGVWNNPDGKPVKDGQGAWGMTPATEDLTYTMDIKQGSVMAVVLPYDTYELPTGVNGEPVQTYSVCGYQTSDDGKTVTGINVAEWTEQGIKAGTPFIIAVDGENAYNRDSTITVDFYARINSTVTQKTSPQNGLYGTFSGISLPDGMICFQKDSAYVKPGASISNQSGYLDVNGITIDPAAKVARTIPVSGVAVNTVGIKPAVSAQKAVVDVYTSDGVPVRRNVKASEAAKGLAKGIYIIGKKKVLVK